ncbi:MAG: DUF4105 domain-containing protein [Reichenbachiella sp.]
MPILSDSAEITLLTMSPGQSELYAAFGHSALRVKDEANRIDGVFNYGIFNFNQPNFYLNFTKGKLYYKLGIRSYPRTMKIYMGDNRTITEQYFDLTQEQKQQMFELLANNAKPENASYYYNYCFNNCSTKIRDVLEEVLPGKLAYDFSYAEDSLSYRGLMDKYLNQQPWGDLGIDLCLGSQIDAHADGRAYTYMPEYLQEAFDKAKILEGDSARSLVKETKILNTATPMPDASSLFKPIHLFVLVFFLTGIVIHRSLKYNVNSKMVDAILFGITGFIGCFLLFLWFGTDHLSKGNFNLIWCMPLNLVALFALYKSKWSNYLRYYFLIYGVVLILLIIFREMMTQELHFAFIPMVLALAIRSFYLFYIIRLESEK